MLDTQRFGDELKKNGFNFYAGVPCSYLKNFINYAFSNCKYIMAANEGDAVAIASGASIAGEKAVVLLQNSGLTNAISPLTSLTNIFKIPILGFVSLRGDAKYQDESQHILMGKITTKLLDLLEIPWEVLSTNINKASEQIKRADCYIKNGKAFFLVVRKDTFSDFSFKKEKSCTLSKGKIILKSKSNTFPTRLNSLHRINKQVNNKDTIVITTTGKTSRELYEIEDKKNHFYMVGSMGCLSPLALGLSLNLNKNKVIAIDGDGALLMRMGALAVNGYFSPSNMLHILLDNNTYDSTGGQQTVSCNVDFVTIASAAGYDRSIYLHSLDELEENIRKWYKKPSLTFLYLRIKEGSKHNLGRPKVQPRKIKDRCMLFIKDSNA
jgi:phosphonopyruvate decarboxylase